MTAVATCWDSGAVVLNGYTDRAAVTVGGHGVAVQMPVDVGQAVERYGSRCLSSICWLRATARWQ